MARTAPATGIAKRENSVFVEAPNVSNWLEARVPALSPVRPLYPSQETWAALGGAAVSTQKRPGSIHAGSK